MMLGFFTGMLLYSGSIPVSLFSVYTATWFFPEGIPLFLIPIGLRSILAYIIALYLLLNIRKLDEHRKKLFKDILIFILLIIFLFLLIVFFSTQVPISNQLTTIKYTFYYSLTFFLVLFFRKESDYSKYMDFVLFLIIISGIYGVYTYIVGVNPFGDYIIIYLKTLGEQGLGGDFIESERGFLTSRIYGFTVHPLMFGGILVLCTYLMIFRFFHTTSSLKKLVLIIALLFCFILIILTGSRSILIGFLGGILFYTYKHYPFKTIVFLFMILLFYMGGALVIKDEFVRSVLFFWEDNAEFGGSSSSMRFIQLESCLEAVSNDAAWLFGLGHNWSGIYLDKYGNVPPFQGFESILFTKIVNYGIIGSLLYFCFVFYSVKNLVKKYITKKKERNYIYAFILSGLTIALFTGEYYGYKLYLVFIILFINYYLIGLSSNKSDVVIFNKSTILHDKVAKD